MPGHIKAMLAGVSLHVPVRGGALALGTWQGIYLVEHRARPHRREVMLQFIGSNGVIGRLAACIARREYCRFGA